VQEHHARGEQAQATGKECRKCECAAEQPIDGRREYRVQARLKQTNFGLHYTRHVADDAGDQGGPVVSFKLAWAVADLFLLLHD